jgi:hypothetical protein
MAELPQDFVARKPGQTVPGVRVAKVCHMSPEIVLENHAQTIAGTVIRRDVIRLAGVVTSGFGEDRCQTTCLLIWISLRASGDRVRDEPDDVLEAPASDLV